MIIVIRATPGLSYLLGRHYHNGVACTRSGHVRPDHKTRPPQIDAAYEPSNEIRPRFRPQEHYDLENLRVGMTRTVDACNGTNGCLDFYLRTNCNVSRM